MNDKPHQNLAIIGHVDHGRSTLVGRFLFKAGSVPEHAIEQHQEEAEKKDRGGFEFVYVMSNLVGECKRSVTIDIAHQESNTNKLHFAIVDCPGHRDFVKNMITGASQADNAALVVAADSGVAPQTRERVFFTRTLGIGELTIMVNRMDVADYNEDKYKDVKEQVNRLLKQARFNSSNATYVPIPAFESDNIVGRPDNTSRRDDDILLEILNNLPVPQPSTDASLRLPIRGVYTISGIDTTPVGCIETGTLSPDDNTSFQPSDVGGEIKTVETYREEVDQAGSGDNVGLNVRGIGKDDIHRSDVCGPADDPSRVVETFKVQAVVMQYLSTITVGYTPVLHARTVQVVCIIGSIDQKLDPASDEAAEENPDFTRSDDAAIMTIRPQKSFSIEPSPGIPELGGLAVHDMGQIITAGKVLEVNE